MLYACICIHSGIAVGTVPVSALPPPTLRAVQQGVVVTAVQLTGMTATVTTCTVSCRARQAAPPSVTPQRRTPDRPPHHHAEIAETRLTLAEMSIVLVELIQCPGLSCPPFPPTTVPAVPPCLLFVGPAALLFP